MSDLRSAVEAMRVRAETSVGDPDTCTFFVSRVVHPGGPFFFGSREEAAGSPVSERLLALPGVACVLIAESTVTVGKDPGVSWTGLKSAIGAAIRTQLLTGIPAITTIFPQAGRGRRTDEEPRPIVQQLLDREVNPSLAGHGGKLSIVDARDHKLLVAMSGGCQGCPASRITLTRGVEVLVRRVAPEIVEVVDTTDHAAGRRPFYAPARPAR
jgi:Fe-S cluster biogenesis protein NfuA